MAKAPVFQPQQRRFITPIDQFGRGWSMCIEVITGDPTGAVNPGLYNGTRWEDPLATPGHFVELEHQGQASNLSRCQVRFDRWITEREHDEEVWLGTLHEIALAKYTSISPEQAEHLQEDPLLLRLAGPKPHPSSAILRKASEGYKPFLGLAPLTTSDRAVLKKITLRELAAGLDVKAARGIAIGNTADAPEPPDEYKAFVSWALKYGHAKNLTEAAGLWNTHRQSLNPA